jgi:DNA polymerase-3 subunit epsilon
MDTAEAAVLPQDLVFVDLETTGGNAALHRITEVGIVRVRHGELIEEWSSLVNPECPIPPYIENFTGISNEMVANAPRFSDIARLVLEKLQSAPLAPVFVAHNARFDYAFLRAEFRRLDLNFCAPVLCTVKLSRRLFPQHRRHSLDAVMERHALTCNARHRALGDAQVLRDFWFTLRREVPEAALAAAARTVLGAHRLPAYLPAGLADELPDSCGVYRFFGEDGALLYVGRSHSLRTRILAHFAGEEEDARERRLKSQVRRIDWFETAGELGAILRETQWIRTQQPRYNRRLNSESNSFTLEPDAASGAVAIVALEALGPRTLERCRGVFHSQKDARKALGDIARAHGLCLKVLGLEPGPGSCLAHQLGKCRGACVGREPLALHQVRLQMALAALKLKPWPFPGRVALRERNALGDIDVHVLDHWSHIGTARSDEDLAALALQSSPAGFDAYVYRILARYLDSHPKPDWQPLGPPDGPRARTH